MDAPKRLVVLWSRASLAAAGPLAGALEDALLREAAGIVTEAHGWFVHVLPGSTDDDCYLCLGREGPDGWMIRVRTATYPAQEGPRGSAGLVPSPVATPDNEDFAARGAEG